MSAQSRGNDGIFRPPARVVIVHTTLLFGIDAINALCESLLSVSALALSLSGASRIPFLGLSAIGFDFQGNDFVVTTLVTALGDRCIPTSFPLQHLRTPSFPKLQASLDAIKSSLLHSLSCSDSNSVELFQSVLGDVLNQHHEQSATFHQLAGYLPQLEVIVITPTKATEARSMLSKAVRNVDLQMVKKVQLVCIDREETEGNACNTIDDLDTAEETPPASHRGEALDDDDDDAIDVVCITPDVLQFDSIFKRWLLDDSTDREHVHISIPTGSRSSAPITLKCDIVERMLPPQQLPGASRFSIDPASGDAWARGTSRASSGGMSLSKSLSTSASQSVQDSQRPHHLSSIAIVRTNGVCDSVTFGTPLLLRPTACWRLDWEELECNQQRFHALTQLLGDQNEAIVLAQEVLLPAVTPATLLKPVAHFLALGCQSSSALLVKPIAIGDIILPADASAQIAGTPAPEHVDVLRTSLHQLEHMEVYNPFLFPGFLNKALVNGLLANASTNLAARSLSAGGSKKRKSIQRPNQANQPSKKPDRGSGMPTQERRSTSAFKNLGVNRSAMAHPGQHQTPNQRYNPVTLAKASSSADSTSWLSHSRKQ